MTTQIRTFFAGAGLLIFGLASFEQAIKTVGGRNLKRLLQQQTRTVLKGFWSGVWMSTLTTSSTFVSLLLVAFVGSGLLALPNALSVIIGANIGTTLSSLLVAYVGFGGISLSSVAMPIVAICGVILMVCRSSLRKEIARMGIGIGLLFIGLGYMKHSVEVFSAGMELDQFIGPRSIGLLSLVLTGLLHSQATMQLILLSSLSSGIIGVESAFAGIIGANIGTTLTALTAALGGSKAHKQIAYAHFFQNILAGVLGVIFFERFLRLCTIGLSNLLGYGSNMVFATAWFNAVFNIITGIPFLFVIPRGSKFLLRITGQAGETHHLYIDKFRSIGQSEQTIGIQWYAAKHDLESITHDLFEYLYAVLGLEQNEQGEKPNKKYPVDRYDQHYHITKERLSHVYAFLYKIQELPMQEYDVKRVYDLIKRADSLTYTAKLIRSGESNIQDLGVSVEPVLKQLYADLIVFFTEKTLSVENMNNQFDMVHDYLQDHEGLRDIPTIITMRQTVLKLKKRIELLEKRLSVS